MADRVVWGWLVAAGLAGGVAAALGGTGTAEADSLDAGLDALNAATVALGDDGGLSVDGVSSSYPDATVLVQTVAEQIDAQSNAAALYGELGTAEQTISTDSGVLAAPLDTLLFDPFDRLISDVATSLPTYDATLAGAEAIPYSAADPLSEFPVLIYEIPMVGDDVGLIEIDHIANAVVDLAGLL